MQKSALSIAAVSRDTGIAKEVLRKWETRYGFPLPQRDALGNRLYTEEQFERLLIIKKLIDAGMRPAQVVPLEHPDLLSLLNSREAPAAQTETAALPRGTQWLTSRDPEQLREGLRHELERAGLNMFIADVMPAMCRLVGDAWERGQIAVRDEHVYTEIAQELLRDAVARIHNRNGTPRILLTTPPGELHTLGILLTQGFLALQGACCVSMGAQSPPAEIVLAANDYKVDIVGISFSASYPKRKVIPFLREVRAQLAVEKLLWAGGAGVAGVDVSPRGVQLMHDFSEAATALEKYRKRAGRSG